jgi:hypothetical protein
VPGTKVPGTVAELQQLCAESVTFLPQGLREAIARATFSLQAGRDGR